MGERPGPGTTKEEKSITAFPPWFLTSSRKGVITSQGLDVDDLETITKVLASTIHIFGMTLVLDTRICVP